MRPWKAEQLGGGYRVSSWVEKTAYEAADAVIAVSAGMREDILRSYPSVDPDRVKVVHNGIDSQLWQRERDEDVVRRHGVDPDRPSVIFVGRITRQKGLPYLLRAAAELPPEVQLVLLRRRARHPRDQGRGRAPHRRPARDAGTASSGCRRCCRGTRSSRCSAAPRSSSARRSTSPSASSTSRRWPASCRSSRRRPAASPRSSSHGETGLARAHRPGAGRHRHPGRPRPLRRRPRGRADGCRERRRPRRPDGSRRAVVVPWSRSPGARSASRPTRSTSTS